MVTTRANSKKSKSRSKSSSRLTPKVVKNTKVVKQSTSSKSKTTSLKVSPFVGDLSKCRDVVVFTRASTRKGKKTENNLNAHELCSTEVQETFCRQYANLNNYYVIKKVIEVGSAYHYGDNYQKNFKSVISDILQGRLRVGAILVFEPTRFSRNVRFFTEVYSKLSAIGVAIIPITNPECSTATVDGYIEFLKRVNLGFKESEAKSNAGKMWASSKKIADQMNKLKISKELESKKLDSPVNIDVDFD